MVAGDEVVHFCSHMLPLAPRLGLGLGFGLRLGSGLEEVFVFDSKRANRDRAVEAVSEARAG